jgi:hypothetical protein
MNSLLSDSPAQASISAHLRHSLSPLKIGIGCNLTGVLGWMDIKGRKEERKSEKRKRRRNYFEVSISKEESWLEMVKKG